MDTMNQLMTSLTDEGEHIARRRKSDGVNPTTGGAAVFTTHGVERELFTPYCSSRPVEGEISQRFKFTHAFVPETHFLSTSLM
jgi:hypothetical protein